MRSIPRIVVVSVKQEVFDIGEENAAFSAPNHLAADLSINRREKADE